MKKLALLCLCICCWMFAFSQTDVNKIFEKSPEVIFKFHIQDKSQLETLTRMISIDNVKEHEVTAYANQKEFEKFLGLNIPYEIVEKPVLTDAELNMMDFEAIKNSKNDWNYYPTYDAYVAMMNEFATNYPELCRVVEFGSSVQNRKLLACVISKNVAVREAEPQVFWTSSMHGDETTGYVLMLRYIDYLLSNYGTDPRITNFLDNMEIWINPLANPDGTYRGGNTTVGSAIRYNANYVDLNRNYKDWKYGDHPDGEAWQIETNAFTDMQAGQSFVLGANLHGGTEVCNYPWDNNFSPRTADDLWWQFVCREYADTVHLYNPSYMIDYDNGITYGTAMYTISGGRQDYANYYNHNREFTLEISNIKNPSAAQLPNFWNWNYRSFLNYTQQALYGIHGIVTDAATGEPLPAKIFINNHDINESYVLTDPRVGFYARPIKGGTYSVTYSADGYVSQTVEIIIADRQKVVQNIELVAPNPPVCDFSANQTTISVGDGVEFTDLSQNTPTSWNWYFEGGTPETSTEQNPAVVYETAGEFDVKLVVENEFGKDSVLRENYIIVSELPVPPVANFEADATTIFDGESVHFTDLSENATAWEWYFEGGTPETSTDQNPTITYEKEGTFDVKLTVTNEDGTDEMLKQDYIIVEHVGIGEVEKVSVKVFPNPVQQGATITIDAAENIQKIELINMAGNTIKSLNINSKIYNFTINGLASGVYLMKIETEKGVSVTKIQVQ